MLISVSESISFFSVLKSGLVYPYVYTFVLNSEFVHKYEFSVYADGIDNNEPVGQVPDTHSNKVFPYL